MKKPIVSRALLPLALACLAMLALGWLAQFVWFPQGWPLENRQTAANVTTEISPVSQVVISEVMSSNKTAWPGADGLYPDWVEITNQGESRVDISGWTLTDSADRKIKFTFQNHVLEGGEYVVVYLTGELQSAPGQDYQAPFRLSSTGDSLLLYDEGGAIMQAMNLPALGGNMVYALEGASGSYRSTSLYTPGLANTRSNHAYLTGRTVESPVVINEVMAENATVLKDGQGNYSDWIELYNTGSQKVDLTGYGLSDDGENLLKWRFPQTEIGPGEYLILFLSGGESTESELHANFRLAGEGESLYFCDPQGGLIQQIDFDILRADQSWSRDAQGAYRISAATPGKANS